MKLAGLLLVILLSACVGAVADNAIENGVYRIRPAADAPEWKVWSECDALTFRPQLFVVVSDGKDKVRIPWHIVDKLSLEAVWAKKRAEGIIE